MDIAAIVFEAPGPQPDHMSAASGKTSDSGACCLRQLFKGTSSLYHEQDQDTCANNSWLHHFWVR